jgi:hypothetical protein
MTAYRRVKSAECKLYRGEHTDLPDGQISELLSSPLRENFLLSPSGKSSLQVRPILSPQEGRIMIVTNVGMGCGGRGSVARAGVRRAGFACERKNGAQTNDAEAYGEVVWS